MRTTSEPGDALALRGRIRTLRIGAWPSVFACGALAVYSAMTPERPNRELLFVVCAATFIASLGMFRVPIEPLVRSRWREGFFLCWSASLISLVTVMAGLDGGVSSPLAAAYFGPLAYAALSYPLQSLVVVALLDVAAFLGLALAVGDPDAPFVFVFAATLVTAAWISGWQAHNLDGQRRDLARISRTDPLTGALNRRGFEERLAVDLVDGQSHGRSVALVLLDLDRFKEVNDNEGHAAGDELLCWVVDTLQRELHARDSLGRLGGDEFALVLDQDRGQARATVDRLQTVLAERASVSAGLAVYGLDGLDADALHHAADAELYAEKHGGGGRAPGARELSWAAALARCVDERMAVRHEHSRTVAELAGRVAERLGWPQAEVGRLRLAAILHDVGKINVPEAILRKSGPLSAEEYAVIAKHADAGADVVARIEGLEGLATWIRHSHERVDGKGYPDGLAGQAIPLASRILLVADAYDAMTSDRPYSTARSSEEALEELRRHAGTQFDATCVAELEADLTGSGQREVERLQ